MLGSTLAGRMSPQFKPQQRIAGYEVLEMVGKGGMGEVYRACQISMDRIVALKVLSTKLAKRDPSFAQKFIDEARAAGRLNHPNIIAVHDVGRTTLDGEEIDYFSMEFVDGETVKDVIVRQGICPMPLTIQVMQAMSEALVYAEAQGVVHRDIKPDNIMITSGGAVKLADLGLALQVGSDESEINPDPKARKVMGTPMYMSPEQARGLATGHASDQYSLGATLFHMLTGRSPFIATDSKGMMKAHVLEPVPDPRAVVPDLPEGWRDLCMRLMAKDATERFPGAVDLRFAVKAAIEGVSRRGRVPTARGVGGPVPGAIPAGVRKALIGGGALVALLVVGGLVLRSGGGGDKVDPRPITPPAGGPAKPGEDPAVARARMVIGELPADPAAAIASLDQALAGAGLPAAAREAYSSERARREQLLKASASQQAGAAQNARLAAIEDHLAQGRLTQAQTGLAAYSDQADTRIADLRRRFDAALAGQHQRLDERLAAADAGALQALLVEIAALPFDDTQRQSLEAAGVVRQQLLAADAAQVARAAEVGPRWTALAEALEQLRYSTRYDEVKAQVAAVADGFPTSESQAQARALVELSAFAEKGETVLRNHVRQRTPAATLRINKEIRKVALTALNDKDVQAKSAGTALRLDRQGLCLNYRELLDQALEQGPAEAKRDKARILGAFLFMWSPSEAVAQFRQHQDDPLARAVLALEEHRKAMPLVARVARLDGGRVQIGYDFLPGDTTLFADFVGNGAKAGEYGLLWRSDQALAKGATNEAGLPTLAWKGRLNPPLRIEARLRLNRDTHIALLGVQAGDHFHRIGFNLRLAKQVSVMAMVTDGTRFTPGTPTTMNLDLTQAVKVEIVVDDKRKLSLFCEGSSIDRGKELPAGPLGFVFQLYQAAVGGAIEVESLTFEGAVVE